MQVIAERYVEIANTRRAGGQGDVFQAADIQQAGRTVAVKVIPAASDDLSRIYFERETAALRTLSHPNILALRDSGIDQARGLYYVILDWVPETIKTWLTGFAEPPGWDDVAESVALPLASALAHSHSLSVLHRDIKPANVLWDGKTPLLADFALSKIKSKIAGVRDATVLGATSGPWAPPDQASRGSTRFDVYGLAATLLQCVTQQEFQDYHHIAQALVDPDPPPEVVDLLTRALDPNPANRPADGQVFYFELQAIQTARSAKWHRRREIAFELTTTARQALEAEGGGRSAEAVIDGCLGSATYVVPRLKTLPDGRSELTAEEFRLVGDQVQLVLTFDNDYKLVAKRAEIGDFEQFATWRKRDEAVLLDGRDWVWTARRPANPTQMALATKEISQILQKAVQDSGDRTTDRYRHARLNNWSKLIDAKEQLEKRLEEPITYTHLGGSGHELVLQAASPPTTAVLDQDRVARATNEAPGKGTPVTIVDIDGTDVTVRVTTRRGGGTVPREGELVRDRTPSRVAIRRQKDALAALRDGSAARPHLRELVLDPSQVQRPEPVAFTPRTADLDDDKKVAISHALGSTDLFLVEGPPGTGKTSFICELVNQYLASRPQDKVLVVSQMHVAIDNAITRLFGSGVTEVVRLSSNDDRVDPEASHLLLSNKLRAWAQAIAERATQGMAELAQREGVQVEHLALALRAEEALSALRKRDTTAALVGPLTAEDRLDNEELSEERVSLLADYRRATERADEVLSSLQTMAAEVGVAVAAKPDEQQLAGLVAQLLGEPDTELRRLHQLIATQGDWLSSLNDPKAAEPMFLPTQSVVAGTCMGFLSNSNIQEMQFDLCIIDEASRATAAELLVPMTRSKRWVMVGDPKQLPPMMEEVLGREHNDLVETYDLDRVFLSTSLFDTLLAEVPQECRARLVTQHRMAAPIGELISHTFYGGSLIHDPVAVVAAETIDDDERVVWFSTSHRSTRHEETRFAGDSSLANTLEVEQVCQLVHRLNTGAALGKYQRTDSGKLEILILSGYRKQCVEIERALRRGHRLDNVDVQIKTVDAVQGRESDVVIFSVTRSNLRGELGFLGEPYEGRMNVALSRAREILWIVGDAEFCQAQPGPLKKVLHHISTADNATVHTL